MAIDNVTWLNEPWIKKVTRQDFVKWGEANGMGNADELGKLYDTVVPPPVAAPKEAAAPKP